MFTLVRSAHQYHRRQHQWIRRKTVLFSVDQCCSVLTAVQSSRGRKSTQSQTHSLTPSRSVRAETQHSLRLELCSSVRFAGLRENKTYGMRVWGVVKDLVRNRAQVNHIWGTAALPLGGPHHWRSTAHHDSRDATAATIAATIALLPQSLIACPTLTLETAVMNGIEWHRCLLSRPTMDALYYSRPAPNHWSLFGDWVREQHWRALNSSEHNLQNTE